MYEGVSYTLASWLILGAFLHLLLAIFMFCHTQYGGRFNIKSLFVPIKGRLNEYFQVILFAGGFILSLLTIIDTETLCCVITQQHFGLFTVALSWINMIRLFAKLPVIGHHAIIFGRIIWTFITLAMFAIFVVLGSAIILMTVFHDPLALVHKVHQNNYN